MIMNQNIHVSEKAIREFCGKWDVQELGLFGSVLRDDFREDSDVDVLVRFSENSHWTLFDLSKMDEELEAIFGRKVDLVDKGSVEHSYNWIRRQSILSSAETIYAAG